MASSDPPPEGFGRSNPADTLRVWTSSTGLPVRVQIAPALLARGAGAVAAEVLRLCR
jgi:hypothetical protein